MYTTLIGKVQEQFTNKLPFVVYSKPKSSTVRALFQSDDRVHHLTDFNKTGFVMAPFHSAAPTILMLADETYETTAYPKKATTGLRKDFSLDQEVQKAPHMDLVQKAVKAIRSGDLAKVVVSRCFELTTRETPWALLRRLLVQYPKAFCYLWYHPKVGCWLGATPELLVRIKEDRFTTMSLAGTKPYIEGTEPVWGAKELEEQQLVTHYIEEVLKERVTELRTKAVENVQAGNLWHLRTKIEGRIQQNPLKVVDALHPTPAVCGLPSQKALDFILANEGYDRAFYTGYLGELNMDAAPDVMGDLSKPSANFDPSNTATDLFVNLRCMQLAGDNALVYVGGGITAASDPLKEWEETVNKSTTMLRVLLGT